MICGGISQPPLGEGVKNKVSTLILSDETELIGQWVLQGNAVELSSLTHQMLGRQPFAAETNRVPSRHRDADLLLNSTVLVLQGKSVIADDVCDRIKTLVSSYLVFVQQIRRSRQPEGDNV